MTRPILWSLMATLLIATAQATEPLDVWPNLAPGESARSVGEALPARSEEQPTVTRMVNITRPTLSVHIPEHPNGAAAIILPGGGFSRVVPDKEGTEAAQWLTRHGVTAFVLSYRTTEDSTAKGWVKPLQDVQRAMAVIRSRADQWNLNPERIGIVAFSAGGQVGARLLCDVGRLTYDRIDALDDTSHRPDFAVLVYPWNLYDPATETLVDRLVVPSDCPPTFLVHTHDDRSSALGTVLFYAGLKRHNLPAELHVFGNGGHGYGLRPVEGSLISTWPEHAAHWLTTIGIVTK
jgi:acetyl esterase/lipase